MNTAKKLTILLLIISHIMPAFAYRSGSEGNHDERDNDYAMQFTHTEIGSIRAEQPLESLQAHYNSPDSDIKNKCHSDKSNNKTSNDFDDCCGCSNCGNCATCVACSTCSVLIPYFNKISVIEQRISFLLLLPSLDFYYPSIDHFPD
jgi:hypothetical protein